MTEDDVSEFILTIKFRQYNPLLCAITSKDELEINHLYYLWKNMNVKQYLCNKCSNCNKTIPTTSHLKFIFIKLLRANTSELLYDLNDMHINNICSSCRYNQKSSALCRCKYEYWNPIVCKKSIICQCCSKYTTKWIYYQLNRSIRKNIDVHIALCNKLQPIGHDKWYRIFCIDCSDKLTQCLQANCSNMDINKYCLNHFRCYSCKKQDWDLNSLYKCDKCNEYICNNTGNTNCRLFQLNSQPETCVSCTLKTEALNLYKLIKSYSKNIFCQDVVNIIHAYGEGYIVKCNYAPCGNFCNFDNMIQINCGKDYEGRFVEVINDENPLECKNINGQYIMVLCNACWGW